MQVRLRSAGDCEFSRRLPLSCTRRPFLCCYTQVDQSLRQSVCLALAPSECLALSLSLPPSLAIPLWLATLFFCVSCKSVSRLKFKREAGKYICDAEAVAKSRVRERERERDGHMERRGRGAERVSQATLLSKLMTRASSCVQGKKGEGERDGGLPPEPLYVCVRLPLPPPPP